MTPFQHFLDTQPTIGVLDGFDLRAASADTADSAAFFAASFFSSARSAAMRAT